jgi:acyl-CoA synthetase (AMP-forming)/AMP-acid ligase II
VTDPTTIGGIVERNALKYRDKTAFQMPDGRGRSFEEFGARVGRLCAALRALGLAPGDRVALLSRNRIECIEACCVSAQGFVAVPVNWRLTPSEIFKILGDCQPRALIADAAHRSIIDSLGTTIDFISHLIALDDNGGNWLGYEELLAAVTPVSTVSVAPGDAACLVYTSGTTGAPKGATLSHEGLLRNCSVAIAEIMRLKPADVALTPMPLFHVGGLWFTSSPVMPPAA